MNRLKIISLSFAAILCLTGCKSTTPPQGPAPIIGPPTSQSSVSDVKRDAEVKKKRDADTKRRRGNSTDIDKTDAYRKYVP